MQDLHIDAREVAIVEDHLVDIADDDIVQDEEVVIDQVTEDQDEIDHHMVRLHQELIAHHMEAIDLVRTTTIDHQDDDIVQDEEVVIDQVTEDQDEIDHHMVHLAQVTVRIDREAIAHHTDDLDHHVLRDQNVDHTIINLTIESHRCLQNYNLWYKS